MKLFWKEQLKEASVTSTFGQANVDAGVTEPRSLGGGPGLLRHRPEGRALCLAPDGISEFSEGTPGTGTQTSELACEGSCIEISPAALLIERLQAGVGSLSLLQCKLDSEVARRGRCCYSCRCSEF